MGGSKSEMSYCSLHGNAASYLETHDSMVEAIESGLVGERFADQYFSERVVFEHWLRRLNSSIIDVASCCGFREKLLRLLYFELGDDLPESGLDSQTGRYFDLQARQRVSGTGDACGEGRDARVLVAPNLTSETRIYVTHCEACHIRTVATYADSLRGCFIARHEHGKIVELESISADSRKPLGPSGASPYSFIICAPGDSTLPHLIEQRVTFSSGRRRSEFETSTAFIPNHRGVIELVRKVGLSVRTEPISLNVGSMRLQHHPDMEWSFVQGTVLSVDEDLRCFAGWSRGIDWRSDLGQWLTVIRQSVVRGNSSTRCVVPGDCWDMVPGNVVRARDGRALSTIDLEWVALHEIPAAFIVWRGVWLALSGSASRERDAMRISAGLCDVLNLGDVLDEFLDWERQFQRGVRHVPF